MGRHRRRDVAARELQAGDMFNPDPADDLVFETLTSAAEPATESGYHVRAYVRPSNGRPRPVLLKAFDRFTVWRES